MKIPRIFSLLLATFLLGACNYSIRNSETIHGSGVSASETRSVNGFTGVEIAGSADVTVDFGEVESVVVKTDDNLLPYIETKVSQGSLVISTKPDTNVDTELGIHVDVTMKRIDKARITGSGTMNIAGIGAKTIQFDLPGSGTITAAGKSETVNVTLNGSGNVQCGDLQAETVSVQLNGSGIVTVFASKSISAIIQGSGSVRYRGNPTKVEQSIPGSGSINAVP